MRSPRPVLTALLAAGLVVNGAWPMATMAAAAPLRPIAVQVGQAADITHIEFKGSDPVSVRKDGKDLVLRFDRAATPDLVQLKVAPPRFTKAAVITPSAGGLELRLSPADGAVYRLGKADGATFVNFAKTPEAAAAPPPAAPKDQIPVRRADPVPAGGVVRMQPDLQGRSLSLKFPWRAPLGAAVFRRGEALWMVFDAKARLDLAAAPHGMTQFRRIDAVEGKDFTAVRILAPPTTLAVAEAQGATWTLTLGPTAAATPQGVALSRDDQDGPAALKAQVAGSTGVFWIDDPVVGDRLAVVTALAPAKGLDQRRAMVDAVLLPSMHGLAIQPLTDDLAVSTDGDIVRIGRPHGLALSPATAQMRRIAQKPDLALPTAASMPALVDFANWSKTGEGGFNHRYQSLLAAAEEEAAKGKGGGVQARLGLARFLLGSNLAQEAIGVLTLLGKTNPTMLGDAEFRGLRGAARAMAGRFKDAQADFSSPVLAEDPSSALWRGYVNAKLGDFTGAREQFSHGRSALYQFAPEWKARFARLDAEAALAVNDVATARNALSIASGEHVGQDETDAIKLTQARLLQATGQADQALKLYDELAGARFGAVAAPAILHATELRLAGAKLKPADAVGILDSLRFKWRGDSTELDAVRALGHIYLSQGRYAEAMEALRSAGHLSPDQPAALAVANDLSTAFRALFLDGQADGLQPIQALALFNAFQDLTPIGADGDLMVRKLVRRLMDVDLLDQAADLLKYQVDNRLDGVPRAQVSTDLATIYLMDKKPEQALQAINNSRTTLLPAALNAQRRIVEARALLALGRGDHALELLDGDKSPEAADVRAEAAWRQRSWPQAGALLEGQLGDRWKSAQPLTGEEQGRLMRAGVAYSLAGDDGALARLRAHFAKLADASNAPDALRIALAGVREGAVNAGDFARVASDTAAFAGWVADMKKRFHDKFSQPVPAASPVKQAQAQTPAPTPVRPPVKKG